jgi:glyoxylase-like metal-dependent hydrolase (beta-lactamase superfamily II)
MIKKFVLGMYQENCYVVFCSRTKKGFIVDPGIYSQEVINYIQEKQLDIEFVLLTHAHGDHICGLTDTVEKFNVPVYIHKKEAEILQDHKKNFSGEICGKMIEREAERLLEDGEIIKIGYMEIKIIHTPGHTPGGICIYIEAEECLISGDTLFDRSIGRTDFRYSSTEALIAAVKEKLYVLPDDTEVYPGHGTDTSILQEKGSNPFVRG